LTTTAGDLDLRIPKLRMGSFFPSLLERRRRVDQALFAVVLEAHLYGVWLDEEVAEFRGRSLEQTAFPYVYLDATFCKARIGGSATGKGGRVVSQAVVIATGVRADGHREVLGFDVGDSESGPFWTAFLRSLRARGPGGVARVVSDTYEGLEAAISEVLIGTSWQRRVHFTRNVLDAVSKTNAEMVAAAIRTIFAQPDDDHVAEQFEVITTMLARSHPKVGRMLSDAAPTSWGSSPTPLPCCYAWPARSWSRPTSNGPPPTALPLRTLHGPARRDDHPRRPSRPGGGRPRTTHGMITALTRTVSRNSTTQRDVTETRASGVVYVRIG